MNEINLTHEKLPRSVLRRLGTLVLALCMALSLLPAVIPPANAAFSDAAMDKLLNWGVVSGYPDGALHPDWSLTRAEFVAMVNRAYGYDELGGMPFIDVPGDAWFRDDVDIGYNANYFTGVSPRMAAPDQQLTREQAVVLLARNMRMQPIEGEIIEFSDGHAFSDWSRGYVRAAKAAGVIGGYSDGSYKPKNNITRGEMAVMLQRALGTLINKPGTHTLSDVYGNVTISSPNVILTDSTIAGDLYITGGLSLGDVTLQNVRVLGNIVIAGGGESESGESVILRNVQADSLIVDSIAGQYLSLAAEGDTSIAEAILRTSAYVQDRTRPGEGLLQITLDSLESAARFTLSGNLETVVNKTPNSRLNIAMGTVATLNIDEKARSSGLNLDINSTVETLNIDTATTVTGVGDIGDLFVNAPGASVEMLPDKVTIRPGLTADVAGQTMNAQQAQESSADPRLLASYPKVRNIAPTNATSVYSANKGGTVYWAVSNTTDGSIGEEELIEPTAENTSIALSGTTTIEQSNTEYTAALEKLTPDTNYYLSTVMTDAHGRHSPVKVASFATPDNTVPAFAAGYPAVMRNYCVSLPFRDGDGNLVAGAIQRDEDGYPIRNYRVQITAMPNKSCVLYYALYPAGSTAPTAQQFRTGALGNPIRSGMEDASKNRINFIELTGLEELTSYDVYLCYIDADGSRSSAVRKLTFKTVDGKPPRFQYETPVVSLEQLTSLRLSANLDEAATIYWVATRDVNYIKDNDNWDDTEWWERACRQIESGTNGIRSGRVNARANVDTTINITGLQPATRYYIYFVAKDSAGNYSEFFRESRVTDGGLVINPGGDPDIEPPHQYTPHNQQPYRYYMLASTLDNIPPTARQEFTDLDGSDPPHPYANTDIRIIFSEAVMRYSTNSDKAQEDFLDFYSFYTKVVNARSALTAAQNGGDQAAIKLAEENLAMAEDNLRTVLFATIKLYNNALSANEPVTDRYAGNEASIGNDWVIDYRKAVVEYDPDSGEMTVIFPTDLEHPENSALNLASGATYHFVLDDICDTSSNKNRMLPQDRRLPDFTTISAQVDLNRLNIMQIEYQNPTAAADAAPEVIPIDMSFSLTPLSTSVEDYVDWDILLWSDTDCKVELYEFEDANGAGAWVAHPLNNYYNNTNYKETGHYSVQMYKPLNENPDPNTKADNYLGYQGRSYFGEFYGVGASDASNRIEYSTFPSVTGRGHVLVNAAKEPELSAKINPRGILERGETKFYGIRITELNGTPESPDGRNASWDGTVNFRVSVLTGTSVNLGNLAIKTITNSVIKELENDPDFGFSIIQIQDDRPFTLQKSFNNRTAPELLSNQPAIEAHDTYVNLSFAIDRSEGTVHYVIAPASEWNTAHTQRTPRLAIDTSFYDPVSGGSLDWVFHGDYTDDGTDPIIHNQHFYTVFPDGGEGYHVEVPYPDALSNYVATKTVPTYDGTTFGDPMTSKLEASAPQANVIYTHRGIQGVPGIVYGSKSVNQVSQTFSVEGLQAETIYFLYVVTEGNGSIFSSRAQVFQFETTVVERPSMLFAPGSSRDSASISTDRNATVQAAVFPKESIEGMDPFNRPFTSVKKDDPAYPKDAEYNSDDFTVLDALLTPYDNIPPAQQRGYGSFFDRFATVDIKNTVWNSIRMSSSGGTGGIGASPLLSQNVSPTNPRTFSFTNYLEGTLQYVLLAMATSPGLENDASGDSRGFGAWSPIENQNNDPPTIANINNGNPGLFIDYKTNSAGRISGSFFIEFDDRLYIYESGAHTAMTASGGIDGDPTLGYHFVPEFFGDMPTSQFSASSVNTGAVRTVKINLLDVPLTGATFSVHRFVSKQNGSPRVDAQNVPVTLSITVSYIPERKVIRIAVEGAYASAWYPTAPLGNGIWELAVEEERPEAYDFTLDNYSLELGPGEAKTSTATLLPVGSQGRMVFDWTPGMSIRGCTLSTNGNTVTVTAPTSVTGELTGQITASLFVGNSTTAVKTRTIDVTVTPRIIANLLISYDEGTARNESAVTMYTRGIGGVSGTHTLTFSVDNPSVGEAGEFDNYEFEAAGDSSKFKITPGQPVNGRVTYYIIPTSDANPDPVDVVRITFFAKNRLIVKDAVLVITLMQ